MCVYPPGLQRSNFDRVEAEKTMRNSVFIKPSALVLSLSLVGAANATIYNFNWNPSVSGVNNGVGSLNSISSTFNNVSNRLSWSYNMGSASNPNKSNGAWLVLSPGPNPKGYSGELAIFYMDFSKNSPILTAYAYNGVNGPSSYLHAAGSNSTPDLIKSSKNDSSWIFGLTKKSEANGTTTYGFDIDATAINNHKPKYPGNAKWTGAAYGSKIGVWFHPVQATFGYSGAALCQFNVSKQGWLDGENFKTTQAVPEPTTMALLGLGGVVAARRRKKK